MPPLPFIVVSVPFSKLNFCSHLNYLTESQNFQMTFYPKPIRANRCRKSKHPLREYHGYDNPVLSMVRYRYDYATSYGETDDIRPYPSPRRHQKVFIALDYILPPYSSP